MKMCRIVFMSMLLAGMGWHGDASAEQLPVCSQQQRAAYAPEYAEVEKHRLFALPILSYPFGVKPGSSYGMRVTVGVDSAGRPVCESHAADDRSRAQPLNPKRRALLDDLANWHYRPFTKDGQPVAAIVDEYIREQELPLRSIPVPVAAAKDVQITLDRGECLGDCPVYSVDIHGDGRVVYLGDHYVGVPGRLAYDVPEADVAQLLDTLRRSDIWSMRSSYEADITDMPTMKLTVRMGSQVHIITDYAGWRVGMPVAIDDFMRQVDDVAKTGPWKALSVDTVSRLQEIHFDFASPLGAQVLVAAVADTTLPDGLIYKLLDLGAPMQTPAQTKWPVRGPDSAIEMALRRHKDALVDPLIERGALTTHGKPDQAKIDAAFRAAILGGRLAQVQHIWDVAGAQQRPSLYFDDVSRDEQPTHLRVPVTLLLWKTANSGDKEGVIPIAKWLLSKGCDAKASGRWGQTLLNVAARLGDADFVRFLLDKGVGPSASEAVGGLAIEDTDSERVALLLLEAGTDLSRMEGGRQRMRELAASNGWTTVLAWLDAHPK